MASKQSKPIPTRFDGPTQKRIKSASRISGLPSSQVIRLGVLMILPQIESGIISLPQQSPDLKSA